MSFISVCKNVIASNNKREWVDPDPAIRISASSGGKAIEHGHIVDVCDKDGNSVAIIYSSTDGKPVLKCGAKVAIVTRYPAVVMR